MPRRGENIRKRKDGRWEARYPVRSAGAEVTVYKSVYAETYRAVKEKRRTAVEAERSFPPEPPTNKTFGEVAALWLAAKKIQCKGATVYRYAYLLNTHIMPTFAITPISQINGNTINTFVQDKLISGRKNGECGLSAAYVRSMLLVIQSVLQFAASQGLCRSDLGQIRKPPIQTPEICVLTSRQQEVLEAILLQDTDATKLGILLSLYTGLRIGEVCALRWSDIDMQEKIMYVRGTVARIQKEVDGNTRTAQIIDKPKTSTSVRGIPLCTKIADILLQEQTQGLSDYVVSDRKGFLSPRTYDYRFHRLAEKAGLPNITYHTLRHTFATRCIESGVDIKSLSEILGHANVSITLNTYVHSSMELKRKQMEKLNF